ncbi:hypothetical protein GT347_11770 [Xylophilus rhododendri]|uniref:Uncharacterized protein n=1 Tax=Xylophilus rhododendri TaxID=2697032 RepID=A0A857J4A6_9BURK|nr:hypothetical protein [Xylophilus rhododendri]QHI98616.1 hypothetical protein GT347_11770 [Xylophilus rhododendri]
MNAPASRRLALAAALAGLGSLGAASAQAAAPLLDPTELSMAVMPTTLIDSGGGDKYTLYADTGEPDLTPVVKAGEIRLKVAPAPIPTPGRSRFVMRIYAQDQAESALNISFVVTRQRCMLTTIDLALNQGSEMGRVVEITPLLLVEPPLKLPRMGDTSRVCTGDGASLAIYFSSPSFDMVQMTAITRNHANHSAAAHFLMLPLPTSKF